MQKRAQLSIFILSGIVLIIAVALLLTMRTPAARPVQVTGWAQPAVSALHSCIESTTQDAIALQMAQGGELNPTDGVYLPPLLIHRAVDADGMNVPSLDDMADDLSLWLPRLLADCVDTARASAPGVTIDSAPATVIATYNDDGAVVRVQLPATIRAGNNRLEAPGKVVTIKKTSIALLRQAAEDIAADISLQGALPAERLALLPYNVTVTTMGLGASIISIKSGVDVYNLAVRESAREQQPIVRHFLGPSTISVSQGSVVKQELDLTSSSDGVEYATNVPWATVVDGWITIDSRGLEPANYAVSIHASGAVQDDTVLEVAVE